MSGDVPDLDAVRGETLTLALTVVLLVSVVAVGVTWSVTNHSALTVLTAFAGFFATFTVTPHLVAYWLDVLVDDLLDRTNKKTHGPT